MKGNRREQRRSGVESPEMGKRRGRVRKPVGCIAGRGRNETTWKKERESGSESGREHGTRGTEEGRSEMAEGIPREARAEETTQKGRRRGFEARKCRRRAKASDSSGDGASAKKLKN